MQPKSLYFETLGWIRGCFCSCHFSVLVNGKAGEWFSARRGFILFVYNFTLVVDVLSCMASRAQELGLVEGYRVTGLQSCFMVVEGL